MSLAAGQSGSQRPLPAGCTGGTGSLEVWSGNRAVFLAPRGGGDITPLAYCTASPPVLSRRRRLQSAVIICGSSSAVCGLRAAVCGLRFAICGLRAAVCGSSSPVCRLQSMVCRLRSVCRQLGGLTRQHMRHRTASAIQRNRRCLAYHAASPSIAHRPHSISQLSDTHPDPPPQSRLYAVISSGAVNTQQ